MRPAARMRCSSSERFIHAPAFGEREHAGERRGLPQAGGRFAGVGDERRDFRPRPIEDGAPLIERPRSAVAVARRPRRQPAPRSGEQPGVGRDLPRDQAMHREAARLDDPVLEQPGGGRCRRRGPPARRSAKPGSVLARAVAVHALRRRLCPPGRRPPRAAAKWAHLIIVTRYDNARNTAWCTIPVILRPRLGPVEQKEDTMFPTIRRALLLLLLIPISARAGVTCADVLMSLGNRLADVNCFVSTDLTTTNPSTTPANNSLAGLPAGAFTPVTDRGVIAPSAGKRTPITQTVPGRQLNARIASDRQARVLLPLPDDWKRLPVLSPASCTPRAIHR